MRHASAKNTVVSLVMKHEHDVSGRPFISSLRREKQSCCCAASQISRRNFSH